MSLYFSLFFWFVEDVEVILGFSYTYLIILLNHIIFYIFYKKE